jgi:hypothetical protein
MERGRSLQRHIWHACNEFCCCSTEDRFRRDTNPDTNRDGFTKSYTNPDTNRDGFTKSYTNPNDNPNLYTYSHTNRIGQTNTNTQTNTKADQGPCCGLLQIPD